MYKPYKDSKRLRQSAISRQISSKSSLSEEDQQMIREVVASEPEASCSNVINTTSKVFLQDHSYITPSPRSIKRKVDTMMDSLENLKKESTNAKQREIRVKTTCKVLRKEVDYANLITQGLKMKLKTYDDYPMELLRKSSHKYSQMQKEVALTLHLYGSKAYDYLRSRNFHLPHPRTLQK